MRPKLAAVLNYVIHYAEGTVLWLDVYSENGLFAVGSRPRSHESFKFVLGSDKRKSVKEALDSLENLGVEQRKEYNSSKKKKDNDDL